MQECAQCKPDVQKKQPRKKEQVMKKRSMKLFLTKSIRANEDVFAVQVGDEAAYACQEGEVRVPSEDGCDYASEKDVGAKIQNRNLLENG